MKLEKFNTIIANTPPEVKEKIKKYLDDLEEESRQQAKEIRRENNDHFNTDPH